MKVEKLKESFGILERCRNLAKKKKKKKNNAFSEAGKLWPPIFFSYA